MEIHSQRVFSLSKSNAEDRKILQIVNFIVLRDDTVFFLSKVISRQVVKVAAEIN